ncbi:MULTISPECIES: PadR family transcriptional regulator [Mumia]|uniref:PadR family transcriptional regulator n=1 Tax=Mumia TaxID=1546255 RepID=UPI0014202A00|nr:PadR family transcriptional regulator [Mumia sp. ZJ430]
MALAHVLLGVLARRPAHGYDLKHEYDTWFPSAKPLAYGQVYATLARLVRDDAAEEVETVPGRGPERIVYAITTAGSTMLKEWLATAESPSGYGADELVRKAVTALRTSTDAAGFLARQRAAHLDAMRQLTHERSAIHDMAQRIAVDHTIAHLDADLRWLEAAYERVAEAQTPR